MMGYIQVLEKLSFSLNDELVIDLILQSLSDKIKAFIVNFNMIENNIDFASVTRHVKNCQK